MAAATAGAVGLGTISASITVGSATLIAGGVPLVAGLFGAAGASLFSYKVHVLTKDVHEFFFIQVPHLILDAEHQNLLLLLDQNINNALTHLTQVISDPQILVDLYVDNINSIPNVSESSFSTSTSTGSSTCTNNECDKDEDEQLDDLMTEFEMLEDSAEEKLKETCDNNNDNDKNNNYNNNDKKNLSLENNKQEEDNSSSSPRSRHPISTTILSPNEIGPVFPKSFGSHNTLSQREEAEKIVSNLEANINGITSKLDDKIRHNNVVHSEKYKKVISVLKAPNCPPGK